MVRPLIWTKSIKPALIIGVEKRVYDLARLTCCGVGSSQLYGLRQYLLEGVGLGAERTTQLSHAFLWHGMLVSGLVIGHWVIH